MILRRVELPCRLPRADPGDVHLEDIDLLRGSRRMRRVASQARGDEYRGRRGDGAASAGIVRVGGDPVSIAENGDAAPEITVIPGANPQSSILNESPHP